MYLKVAIVSGVLLDWRVLKWLAGSGRWFWMADATVAAAGAKKPNPHRDGMWGSRRAGLARSPAGRGCRCGAILRVCANRAFLTWGAMTTLDMGALAALCLGGTVRCTFAVEVWECRPLWPSAPPLWHASSVPTCSALPDYLKAGAPMQSKCHSFMAATSPMLLLTALPSCRQAMG